MVFQSLVHVHPNNVLFFSSPKSTIVVVFILVPVFGTTRVGKPVILVGEHKFYKQAMTRQGQRWICNAKKCNAALITKDDVIIRTCGEHNHK